MLKPFKRRQALSRLRFLPLPALGASLLSLPAVAAPPDLQFEPGFIRQSPGQPANAGALALRALAEHRPLAAGRYTLDLYVNLSPQGKREITVNESNDGHALVPCLSAELLGEIGVREQHLTVRQPGNEGNCIDLATQLDGASADLDTGKLRLNLSIPQSYLRRDTSGAIAESHWDDGINAAFVNYQASAPPPCRLNKATACRPCAAKPPPTGTTHEHFHSPAPANGLAVRQPAFHYPASRLCRIRLHHRIRLWLRSVHSRVHECMGAKGSTSR
ncbi:FimD/PapC N-terminal domain-containing protein [Pseudomonas putida]|uniref:FimD/PapC N-terminal domain-containing protein n=1 Tax=Pseudomonas putida TaxID=303 RepID=UPI00235C4A2F|nr:FimD/PapC N-terminal domain-containing protein [Pseudomonas putida]GLO48542.1 hypothetical protein PPUN109347_51070 [Pseudomonas putida]